MPPRKAKDLQSPSPRSRTDLSVTEAEPETFNLPADQSSTYLASDQLLSPSQFELPTESGSPSFDLNNQLSALSCRDIDLGDIHPGISGPEWQSSFPPDSEWEPFSRQR
jgi:hypothetical protein